MRIQFHRLNAPGELLEVLPLTSPERMLTEERDDDVDQIATLVDGVRIHVLSMVVTPTVDVDLARPKETLQLFERVQTPRALRHAEVMRDLDTGAVSPSSWPVRLLDHADREAAFSVDETDDPVSGDRSFLLIAWLRSLKRNTSRVLTLASHHRCISVTPCSSTGGSSR